MKFCSFGKKDQCTMESGEGKQGKRSWAVIAILSSVVTTLVVLTVVTSLFYGAKLCAEQRDSDHEVIFVEISDDPAEARVQIRESEKIIVTESSGSLGHVDHTVTLQDFKRGLQSVKDISRSKCFIFPINGEFESYRKIAEGNTIPTSSKNVRYVNKTAVQEPIPAELVHHAVGGNIADFCEGLDSHWLIDPEVPGEMERSHDQRVKRHDVEIKVEKEGDKTVITITMK